MAHPARIDTADETLPAWRLDDLFAGRSDPRIAAELAEASALTAELGKLKGAFAAARADPRALGALLAQGIDLHERATTSLLVVSAYASLAASVARDDPAWSKFEADIRARTSEIAADGIFFTLELNALEESEIEAALAADSSAARYRPWLRRVRLGRPHELDAALERLLLDRAPAVANWARLYDETLARLNVRVGAEQLTLAQALNGLSDPDAGRRKRVAGGWPGRWRPPRRCLAFASTRRRSRRASRIAGAAFRMQAPPGTWRTRSTATRSRRSRRPWSSVTPRYRIAITP